MRDDVRRKFQSRIGRDGKAVLNGLGLQVFCKWCIVDPVTTVQLHQRRVGIWPADDVGGFRAAWSAHCKLPRHQELAAIRVRELTPRDAAHVYHGKRTVPMDGWVRYGDGIERVMFGRSQSNTGSAPQLQ